MPKSDGHRVSLDALRGLAALAVVIPHFYLVRGHHSDLAEFISIAAVELFFILSGFVLAPQILRCMSGRPADLMIFYSRRWLRTLPPYVIALSAVAVVSGHFGDRDFFRYLAFIRNFVDINDAGEFFVPAWSLAVEEWFYVVFPLYMVAARSFGMRPLASALLFVGIFAAFKMCVALSVPTALAGARRVVIYRLDAIAFGFLLFLSIDRLRAAPAVALAIFGGIASVYCARAHFEIGFMYAAAAASCGLLAAFREADHAFRGKRSVQIVAGFFAATSYTVYLLHMLILLLLPGRDAGVREFALYLVVLYAVAAVFYWTIERPILEARPSYG